MENTNVPIEQINEAIETLKLMDVQIQDLCESLDKVKETLVATGIAKWKVEEFGTMFNMLQRFSLKKVDVESWAKAAQIKANVE